MTTLNLKKKNKGCYFAKALNIEITIENPFISCGMGSNSWQLVIEIDEEIILNEYFPTKKAASTYASNWVNENL